jgi:hypothetical protein
MANNPLQQYFRQPKIFIELPTSTTYCEEGTFKSKDKLPVFGMTGMDEIIMKTPDALLSGDSLSTVISSCCPNIENPWKLANLDVDTVLTAIRISTYGNNLTVAQVCKNCGEPNEYELDLNKFMEHYKSCSFNNSVKIDNLTIKIRPLTFEEANQFNLDNFALQRKVSQIDNIEDPDEKGKLIAEAFKDISAIQVKMIKMSVDTISTDDTVVTDRANIEEYLDNCGVEAFQKIKSLVEANVSAFRLPAIDVTCSECNTEDNITVELNQTNFFEQA